MNKIDIIQRLLDERHITAKEALVLMEKEKEVVYYPVDRFPVYPQPYTIGPVWCGSGDYTDTMIVSSQN